MVFSALFLFAPQAEEALSFLTVGTDMLYRVEATFMKIKVAVFAIIALESADTPQQTFALFAFRFHSVLIRSQRMSVIFFFFGARTTGCETRSELAFGLSSHSRL